MASTLALILELADQIEHMEKAQRVIAGRQWERGERIEEKRKLVYDRLQINIDNAKAKMIALSEYREPEPLKGFAE